MKAQGLKEFLEELESHCQSTAIATFRGSEGEPFVIDLKRKGNRVTYGYPHGSKELFITQLLNRCDPVASLILRSFTPEMDEMTQLPIKELRGYVLKGKSKEKEKEIKFEKLSPEMMFACHNSDAETGEPLALEQSIRYC